MNVQEIYNNITPVNMKYTYIIDCFRLPVASITSLGSLLSSVREDWPSTWKRSQPCIPGVYFTGENVREFRGSVPIRENIIREYFACARRALWRSLGVQLT